MSEWFKRLIAKFTATEKVEETPEVQVEAIDLNGMTKKELVAYGATVGVELKMHLTKKAMIAKLS